VEANTRNWSYRDNAGNAGTSVVKETRPEWDSKGWR